MKHEAYNIKHKPRNKKQVASFFMLHDSSSGGFSILEVIIALSLFATALTAIMVMTGKGIQDVTTSKNQLTANYLAQEGIELVRYKRDNDGWASFTSDADGKCDTNPCNIGAKDKKFDECISDQDCVMTLNESSGYWGTVPEDVLKPKTVFSRRISIKPGIGQHARNVTSTVLWNQGGTPRIFTTGEVIYDWQ